MNHGVKNPPIGGTSVIYLTMFILKSKYHYCVKAQRDFSPWEQCQHLNMLIY